MFCILIMQTTTFAAESFKLKKDNLAPYATLDLSKRRMVDVNVVNDGTTKYTTTQLNSKLNSILKPKLAEQCIDFKVNVLDGKNVELYPQTIKQWEQSFTQTSGTSYNGDLNWGSYALIYDDARGGYVLIRVGVGYGNDVAMTLPNFDFTNYFYKLTIQYVQSKETIIGTYDITNESFNGSRAAAFQCDLGSLFTVTVERTPILNIDRPITRNLDTTNDYYNSNRLGPYDSTDNTASGLHLSISYTLNKYNKIHISSYSLNNIGNANSTEIYVNYYADYEGKKFLSSQRVTYIKTGNESTNNTIGGNIILDYSSIPNAVAFNITATSSYKYITTNYLFHIVLEKSDGSQLQAESPLEFIKRTEYISENINNNKFTWRDGSEKYFVTLGNLSYPENKYGGKADTLNQLLQRNINIVKLGDTNCVSDAQILIEDNDNNGRFINNLDLDVAINELTEYVLNRVKINLDIMSALDVTKDITTLDAMQLLLSNKLHNNYLDVSLYNYSLKKPNPGVYAIDRFYYVAKMPDDGSSYHTLWYYDETNKKFVKTSITYGNDGTGGIQMYIKSNGQLLVHHDSTIISLYNPTSSDIELVKNISIQFPDTLPIYVWYNGSNRYVYGIIPTNIYIENDKYAYVLYNYSASGYTGVYGVYKYDLDTGALVARNPNDADSQKVVWSSCGTTGPLGTSKLGTYTIGYSGTYFYIYTPDGNSKQCGQTNLGMNNMPVIYPTNEIPAYIDANITETVTKIPYRQNTSLNIIAYLSNNMISDNTGPILDKLQTNQAHFIGVGETINELQIKAIITNNNNLGTYISGINNNYSLYINEMADIIIDASIKLKDNFTDYIAICENQTSLTFEQGNLNSLGQQIADITNIRSSDYTPVSTSSSYSITTTFKTAKIYCYDTSLSLVGSIINYNKGEIFNVPSGSSYIKIVLPTNNLATTATLIDETGNSGDQLAYTPIVVDNENDTADAYYKFIHDNKNIGGKTITNSMPLSALSGVETTEPIEVFSSPGTYNLNMYVKDIPQITQGSNLLINGGAENGLDQWASTVSDSNVIVDIDISNTRISGYSSFIISSEQDSGSNQYRGCLYQDVQVNPDTIYNLSAKVSTSNCIGKFTIYEIDDLGNVINSIDSTQVNNATAQALSIGFKTKSTTTLIRVHIVKDATTNVINGSKDTVIADDIILAKVTADTNYNEYRKNSLPVNTTIYAHRLPRANYTYQVQNNVGNFSIKNLNDNQLSYDPDHTDKANRGIINNQWKYAVITSDGLVTWNNGKVPESTLFTAGTKVLIWYSVQDTDGPNGKGAWSKPKIMSIDGTLMNPVALFTADTPIKTTDTLQIIDQSYTPNFGGTITNRAWTIQKIGDSTFNYINKPTCKTSYTDSGPGKYKITLTVTDSYGKVSSPYLQSIVVINPNAPPTVNISRSLSYVYEGDSLNISMKPDDPDNDNLDLVLEEKKDSTSWKIVFIKAGCAAGTTQTYSVNNITAGDYQYRVTATDPQGLSDTSSLTFTAFPLNITGMVDHEPGWKANWLNYNKYNLENEKPTYGADTFFIGENYLLSANTTDIAAGSSVTADKVTVKILERNYAPITLIKLSDSIFKGEFWNEDMKGTRWKGTTATFVFTVQYSNGTIKTDNVVTKIINDDYWRVKLAF